MTGRGAIAEAFKHPGSTAKGETLVLEIAVGYAFSVSISGVDSMKNMSRKMRAGDWGKIE